jgi:hypothetical protein
MSALMAKVARVDVDRVFFGLGDAVPVDQVKSGDFVFGPTELIPALPAGAVYVAEDCDLPPGKYRLAQTEILAPVTVKLPPQPAAAAAADGAASADASATATPTDTSEGTIAVMQMPLWRFEALPAGMAARATQDAPAPIGVERALYEQLAAMHQAAAASVAPAAITWAKQFEVIWDADNGLVLDYFRKNA